jgi:hypothetical protein
MNPIYYKFYEEEYGNYDPPTTADLLAGLEKIEKIWLDRSDQVPDDLFKWMPNLENIGIARVNDMVIIGKILKLCEESEEEECTWLEMAGHRGPIVLKDLPELERIAFIACNTNHIDLSACPNVKVVKFKKMEQPASLMMPLK